MEKYLSGGEITVKEIKAALRKASLALEAIPVLCGSALKNRGIQPLLNSVIVERLVQRKKSSYAHQVNRTVFYVVILLGLAYYGSAFYGATHPPA